MSIPHDNLLSNAPEGTREAVEYSAEEVDGGGVNINHFLVDASERGEGHGTRAMETMLDTLNDAGAEYVVVNIGGGGRHGDDVADWLRGFGFEIEEVEPDHVTAIMEMEDYDNESSVSFSGSAGTSSGSETETDTGDSGGSHDLFGWGLLVLVVFGAVYLRQRTRSNGPRGTRI